MNILLHISAAAVAFLLFGFTLGHWVCVRPQASVLWAFPLTIFVLIPALTLGAMLAYAWCTR